MVRFTLERFEVPPVEVLTTIQELRRGARGRSESRVLP
jgi:hypothetical protein